MAEQEEIILKVGVEGNDTLLQGLQQTTEAVNELKRQKKALNEEAKKLDKTYTELAQEQQKLANGVKNLNKDLKKGNITQETYNKKLAELKTQSQGVTARMNELGAQQTKLAQKQTQLALETKETNTAYREQEQAILKNNKAAQSAQGSYNQLAAQYDIIKRRLNAMSKAERTTTVEGIALEKQAKEIFVEMDRLQKATGKSVLSVGDYGQALNAATPLMGAFGSQISMVLSSLGQLKTVIANVTAAQNANSTATATGATATNAARVATGGLSKALKFLKVALISTGIGAIVVAFGSLVTAIASTQRGIDALNRILEPLKEVFGTLFGIIQDVGLRVFDALKKAIQDPIGAMKSFAQAVKTNIVNRFEGAVNLVKALARGLVNGIKLMGLGIKSALADVPLFGAGIDQEKLKKDLAAAKKEAIKTAKDVADATAQVATGMDKVQRQAAVDAAKRSKAAIAEAVARGKEIQKLKEEIATANTTLRRDREAFLRQFQEQKEIAQNTLKTDEERLAAAAKAKQFLNAAANLEIAQLKRQKELATLRTKANDTSKADQAEIENLQADINAKEAEAISKRIELGNMANGIVKARQAANKKANEESLKQIAAVEAAQEKAAESERKRAFENEQDILQDKEETLQLEAQLKEMALEEEKRAALENSKGTEKEKLAIEQNFEKQKLKNAKDLEKQIAELRIKSLKNQIDEAIREENGLQDKINALKKDGEEKNAVKIIELTDKLNAKKQEREKMQGPEMAQLKLQNQINERALLDEDQKAAFELALQREQERQEQIKLVKDTALQATDTLQKSFFDRQKQRINEDKQREIEALQAKKEAGVITQAEFEKERLAIDRKAFERQKRTDTSSALINGALAITKTFAQLGFTPAAAAAVIAGGITTATQVAAIQSRQFAEGGFTGSGAGGQKDSSGHVPVGVVHANEYVTPKRVLETAEGAYHVAALESLRLGQPSQGALRGFANGGFTSSNVSVDLNQEGLADVISGAIDQKMQSIRVVNVATDTATQANRDIQIKNQATF